MANDKQTEERRKRKRDYERRRREKLKENPELHEQAKIEEDDVIGSIKKKENWNKFPEVSGRSANVTTHNNRKNFIPKKQHDIP
ncbi:hypothetical protein JTB14_038073 [Gonioctena quinquepunctata]|nr:hypothetical protein JTB14_038073 [Gonioctena quinquepunctata]